MLLSQWIDHSNYELPAATYAHGLSTPVADSIYVNIYEKKKPFTSARIDDSSGVRYPTGIKSVGFGF